MSLAPTIATESEDAAPLGQIGTRLTALEKLVSVLDGRVPNERLQAARQVAGRASERLRLSPAHTVVALAGATGSGKSSLFNALAGLELSPVGLRRPTTSSPHACVWGPEGAGPLLDWLGIPRRHQIARESALDADREAELRGLVLLDVPDHDSIMFSHWLDVDRLVDLVDVLIWVLDPQKYADAAVHDRYLRRLAWHSDVTVVAFNQVDLLTPEDAGACLTDLQRLLAADGMPEARLLATSATRRDGLAALRHLLTVTVGSRQAAMTRLSADLDEVAASLADLNGPAVREDVDRRSATRLYRTLADAAGVPAVGEAVERTYRHRAHVAADWPVATWLRRIGPDPVRRLHLDTPAPDDDGPPPRASMSPASVVQHAEVELALRELAAEATRDMPAPWPALVRQAARTELNALPDELDRAMATTELGVSHRPRWWKAVSGLQWVFTSGTVVGALGLALCAVLALAGVSISGVFLALTTALLVSGLVLGPSLALTSRSVAATAARRARGQAESALQDAVTTTARERILAPVRAELSAYARAREAFGAVRRTTSPRGGSTVPTVDRSSPR